MGIETEREPITAAPGSPTSSDGASSPAFLSSIMHRAVSAALFTHKVQYRACAEQIGAVCGVPAGHVASVWLSGEQCAPCVRPHSKELPRAPAATLAPRRLHAAAARPAQRWMPVDEPSVNVAPGMPLDAAELVLKLEAYSSSRAKRLRRADRRANANAGALSACSGDTDEESESVARCDYKICAQRTGGALYCGFSRAAHHADVKVLYDGLAIERTGTGLYRAALGAGRITMEGGHGKWYYFEVHIVQDMVSGGICVGVATERLPLNKMVGADFASCALHSSGQLVQRGSQFVPLGVPFAAGDTVGCAVFVRSDSDMVDLAFWINGEKRGATTECLWKGLAKEERVLYPAVSLYRAGSKVLLRCCEADWTYAPLDDELGANCAGASAVCSACSADNLCSGELSLSTVGNSSEE